MFRRETALYLYLVVLTAVLVGADFAAYDALSTRSAPPASTATLAAEPAAAAGDPFRTAHLAGVAPASPEPEQPAQRPSAFPEGAACGYDDAKGTVQQFDTLVGMDDPTAGTEGAPVTVVEFFDPNCPHCAELHSVMKTLIETHGDRTMFVFKPIPLGQPSVNQIEALYAANRAGAFNAMLEAQYAQQKRGGLSTEELLAIAEDIGMDSDDLHAAIEEDRFMGTIRLVYQQAQRIGVNSTPTVLINGRFVTAESRTVDCLSSLIEAAG
jgi:protein-disulfide isomerase